jgi:protein-tyrosine phosphatase
MTTSQVQDDGFVRLFDQHSLRLIINCTHSTAARKQTKAQKFLERLEDGVEILNVTQPYEAFGKDGLSLKWDEIQEGSTEDKLTIIVQYACVIARALKRGDNVVVCCTHARSRSPTVIAAFLILFREYSLDELERWLPSAYKDQRPKMAFLTNQSFPNLDAFEEVLDILDEASSNEENSNQREAVTSTLIKINECLVRNK